VRTCSRSRPLLKLAEVEEEVLEAIEEAPLSPPDEPSFSPAHKAPGQFAIFVFLVSEYAHVMSRVCV
jgi:hypothetical protein